MRKIKAIAMIIVIMCGICLCGYYTSRYTRYNCEVIKIEGDLITVKEQYPINRKWEFYVNTNELQVGDIINLKMYEGNPDTIYDDEVYDYEKQENR